MNIMNDIINAKKDLFIHLASENGLDAILKTARALSSEDRVKILRVLRTTPMTIYEISKQLSLPISSTSNHISILEDANLIFVSTQQGIKKHVKMCSVQLNTIILDLCALPPKEEHTAFTTEMPVGHFTSAEISPPCGLYVINREKGTEGNFSTDTPIDFFSPERFFAELVWFDHGFISYSFPNKLYNKNISQLELSFELCSEAVHHRFDWPSDITLKINDMEAATFLSPGDYGGRRGKYSPSRWPVNSTQYGQLYKLKITHEGVYLNNLQVSKTPIQNFLLPDSPFVKVSIGVKEDAIHRGGLNLFGKNFGDYDQSLVLSLYP